MYATSDASFSVGRGRYPWRETISRSEGIAIRLVRSGGIAVRRVRSAGIAIHLWSGIEHHRSFRPRPSARAKRYELDAVFRNAREPIQFGPRDDLVPFAIEAAIDDRRTASLSQNCRRDA
jgi:hypothetical protein